MNFTKAEAISLILGFYTGSCGYWVDMEYNEPEFERFYALGLTSIDVEDERKIVPNEKGKKLLDSFFSQIAGEFIDFMQKRGLECPVDEVLDWFVKEYCLDDIEIGEDICYLIANKLRNFGYSSCIPNLERKKDKLIIYKL